MVDFRHADNPTPFSQYKKPQERQEYVIFVRDYCGTYHARSNGRQASCTAGPKQAAERVAGKLFGDRLFTMKTVTRFTFIATEGTHET